MIIEIPFYWGDKYPDRGGGSQLQDAIGLLDNRHQRFVCPGMLLLTFPDQEEDYQKNHHVARKIPDPV